MKKCEKMASIRSRLTRDPLRQGRVRTLVAASGFNRPAHQRVGLAAGRCRAPFRLLPGAGGNARPAVSAIPRNGHRRNRRSATRGRRATPFLQRAASNSECIGRSRHPGKPATPVRVGRSARRASCNKPYRRAGPGRASRFGSNRFIRIFRERPRHECRGGIAGRPQGRLIFGQVVA